MPTLGRTESEARRHAEPNKKLPAIRISSAVAAGTTLTVTFDQPIVLKGTPNWTTDVAGATPESTEATSLNVIDIKYSASIAAATAVNIPPADAAIRNKVGGFVADTTFAV